MAAEKFIEKRKQYRLPFGTKVIATDGQNSSTAYAANISRGGVFVKSLNPFPINTVCNIGFRLPNQPVTFCVKAKCAHVVFDKQRCEVDNGMGFQFMELTESQKAQINLHILNEKMTYLELKKILLPEKPNMVELERYLEKMPSLHYADLLDLRYKVNRVCTIFEPTEELEQRSHG